MFQTVFLYANLPQTSSCSFIWAGFFLLSPLASILIQVRLALYCPTSLPPHAQQAVRLCLIPLKTAHFPDQELPAPISPIKRKVCIPQCGITFIALI